MPALPSSRTLSLTDHLRKLAVGQRPLWEGPSGSGPNGGVTFSLLNRWLACRKRFGVYTLEGIAGQDEFRYRLEYGNMWHACEEAHAGGKSWFDALTAYCGELCKRYPLSQDEINHWFCVCQVQFPIYLEHYTTLLNDTPTRTSILQEHEFSVWYQLPSKRTVRLRGKLDDLFIQQGLVVKDHKTKGEIDIPKVRRQLSFDAQTMLYVVAAQVMPLEPKWKKYTGKVTGVCYNVVRRPLSGGTGTIRQHKPSKKNLRGESKEEFYTRLAAIIRESPDQYFQQWDVGLSTGDIGVFCKECLDPILENVCWWYEEAVGLEHEYPPPPSTWRHPYGCYNPLNDGGFSEVDEYLNSGSMGGLRKIDNLFPELPCSTKPFILL